MTCTSSKRRKSVFNDEHDALIGVAADGGAAVEAADGR